MRAKLFLHSRKLVIFKLQKFKIPSDCYLEIWKQISEMTKIVMIASGEGELGL